MSQFTSKQHRDLRVTQLMTNLVAKATRKEFQLDRPQLLKINEVCSATARGFREMLLVMCIAKLIDPSYAPTTSLYACNPRALYEGPIRQKLQDAGIPHGKSGPLNVAKATEGINRAWAAQRRPKHIAEVTVELAEWIERSSVGKLQDFGAALLAQLLIEAKRVSGYRIAVQEEADIACLGGLCYQLISDVPDAGNTPERIVGLLLDAFHDQMGSGVTVEGYADGASTTSTTSKKPGDIMEFDRHGNLVTVYEVTVKPFDQQRMDDSAGTLQEYADSTSSDIPEVLVLCRGSDVHPAATQGIAGSLHLATMEFRGFAYQFVDIFQWVIGALCRLTPESRIQFYKALNNYIADANTSEKVKSFWKELHKKPQLTLEV